MNTVFALELKVAQIVFKSLTSKIGDPDFMAELYRMDDSLAESARAVGGAIYPDGFAVIGRKIDTSAVRIVRWDRPNNNVVEPTLNEKKSLLEVQEFQTNEMLNQRVVWEHAQEDTGSVAEPLRITLKRSD